MIPKGSVPVLLHRKGNPAPNCILVFRGQFGSLKVGANPSERRSRTLGKQLHWRMVFERLPDSDGLWKIC